MTALATGNLHHKHNDLVRALEGRVEFPPVLRLHAEIGSLENPFCFLNVRVR